MDLEQKAIERLEAASEMPNAHNTGRNCKREGGGLTMRLVDADKLLQADENSDKILVLGSGKALEIAYALIKKKVENAPTVDAVPVVRCKDCKYHENEEIGMVYCPNQIGGWVKENWFCADGERKDDENA